MLPLVFVVPGCLDERTGGSIYNRRMVEGLRHLDWPVDVIELDASFPTPTAVALEATAGALARIPSGAVAIIDSLIFGAIPDVVARESSRLRLVALVHLPLSASESPGTAGWTSVALAEHRALHHAARVLVTGQAALPLLARYDVPADRVYIVEPGTDRAPLARGSGCRIGDAPVALLCAATVNAIKGHTSLLDALATIPLDTWRLTCAGSLTRDPATVGRVRATLARLGLEDRVSLVGDLDRESLADHLDRADVFVLATTRETYGMAVAEALACGLPVVSTHTGAIPDLIGDDAGLVVSVGDTRALAAALARVIGDGGLRAHLAEGAMRVRDRLSTWDQAVARMAAAIEPLTHG